MKPISLVCEYVEYGRASLNEMMMLLEAVMEGLEWQNPELDSPAGLLMLELKRMIANYERRA